MLAYYLFFLGHKKLRNYTNFNGKNKLMLVILLLMAMRSSVVIEQTDCVLSIVVPAVSETRQELKMADWTYCFTFGGYLHSSRCPLMSTANITITLCLNLLGTAIKPYFFF